MICCGNEQNMDSSSRLLELPPDGRGWRSGCRWAAAGKPFQFAGVEGTLWHTMDTKELIYHGTCGMWI